MGVLDRVSKVDNKFVWRLSRKTNLPFQTVRSLLIHGWEYQEELDSFPRWVPPINSLRKDV